MRLITLIIAIVLSAILSGCATQVEQTPGAAGGIQADASDGFNVLYEQDSWTVFKFEGDKSDDLPDYCSAKSGNGTAFFELIGRKDISCLGAESSQWKFRKRNASGGFFVGNSGIWLGGTRYFSNGLQACKPHGVIGGFAKILANAPGKTIDVFDDGERKIGSFPATGMKNALNSWNTCVNGL